MRPLRLGLVPLGVMLAAAYVLGCATAPPPAENEPVRSPAGASNPASPSDSTFHVTLYTSAGQYDVDDFAIDTSNRKFLRQFYGYRPRDLEQLTTIPFRGIYEIQFIGQIPDQDWNVIFNAGNERKGLQQDEIFDVRIRYPDGHITDFYAIIAGLRGYRDVQRWEVSFAGNPIGLQRVEFR